MPKTLTPTQRLEARLAGRTDVTVEPSPKGQGLTIRPTAFESFTVTFELGPKKSVVSFDGWHEQFDSEAAALGCVAWGLSPACRLEVWMRGETPVRWMTQSLNGQQWTDGSVQGRFFSPFWRTKRLVYLQNRIFDLIEGIGVDS